MDDILFRKIQKNQNLEDVRIVNREISTARLNALKLNGFSRFVCNNYANMLEKRLRELL